MAKRATVAFSNIGKAKPWDLVAANYGFMAGVAVDSKALTELNNDTSLESLTMACAP
jgi:hypothetical protein